MLIFLINLLVMNFVTTNSPNNIEEDSEHYKKIFLKELDIPRDTVLNNIINDVVSEMKPVTTSVKRYYSVSIEKYMHATEVGVGTILTEYIYCKEGNKYMGYYEVGNDVFLFSSDGSYEIQYSNSKRRLMIKTTNILEFGPRDGEEWLYYIMKNCYARWVYRFDLLWYAPKGRKISSDQFFLTAPKRTKK